MGQKLEFSYTTGFWQDSTKAFLNPLDFKKISWRIRMDLNQLCIPFDRDCYTWEVPPYLGLSARSSQLSSVFSNGALTGKHPH